MDEVEIKIMEINPRKIGKILKEKAKFVKRVLQRNYIYTNPVMRLKEQKEKMSLSLSRAN